MIYFKNGDIFKDTSEAIVNAVNCVGVMGKGIALKFKEKYHSNYIMYKTACDNKEVKIGKMFIYKENNKIIINFPTKQHWYNDSKIEYIEDCGYMPQLENPDATCELIDKYLED